MSDAIKTYKKDDLTIFWEPGKCIHSKICWTRTTGLPDVFNPAARPWIKPENATVEELVAQIKKCPSGALSYAFDNETLESSAESTEVEVLPDGPLLVKGSLVVKNSDGTTTEKHATTAFCRCGASTNKPYCDGSHRKIDFKG